MPSEKHLEFIQSAIGRMAGNSFQMKAWNVALASAVIGFAVAKDSRPAGAVLAVAPSLAFWVLDAYYLQLEGAFRTLYDQAVAGTAPSYSMHTRSNGLLWIRAFFRPSVALIHAPMVAVIFKVTSRAS